MSHRILKPLRLFVLLALALSLTTGIASAQGAPPPRTYQVTLHNLSTGQPLSPPVAATHRGGIRMFRVGSRAIPELEAIAEDGNQIPMFDLLSASNRVTEAVDVGVPLTPNGTTVGDFTDAVTFLIQGHPGDRFSLASMLICTNDGIAGLSGARLPAQGSAVYWLNGYDAGTEDNTEMSADIVDPCSALGPLSLAGDPNGNENDAVDTDPPQPVQSHPGIAGIGDLDASAHGWQGPVAKVTITRVDDAAHNFVAPLSGAAEVPAVNTSAEGGAGFWLDTPAMELSYGIKVAGIEDVTQAHIHWGLPNENGPVVAFLYGPAAPGGPLDGALAIGMVGQGDLIGPLAGDWDAFLSALRAGELYVNVHTAGNPAGEIRGQIGAAGP